MNEGISRKTLWNDAAKGGLILGIATILLQEAGQLIPGIIESGIFRGFASVVLWLAKFCGCIYLLRFLMKKFVAEHTEAGNRDSRHFGEAVCLLSAILVAGFSLVNILYINPDLIQESIDTMAQSYSSMMTSEQLESIDELTSDLPVITFFSTLLYCALFGVIASAIISNNVPERKSIFDETKDNNIEEQ